MNRYGLSAARQRLSLSRQMEELSASLGDRPVRLHELLDVFQGRALHLLLIFLALPFVTPVPLPLLSAPFGLLIAFIGMCMALRRKTWMPTGLGKKEIPAGTLPRILALTGRVTSWLERVAKPRLVIPEYMRVFRRTTGLFIASAGLLLSLPLPIPFSNVFPAAAIILLALGGLQRDGLCFLAGTGALVFAFCYFGGIAFASMEIVEGFLSGQ